MANEDQNGFLSKYKFEKIDKKRYSRDRTEVIKKNFIVLLEEQIGITRTMLAHPERDQKGKKQAFGKTPSGEYYATLKYGRRDVLIGDGNGVLLPSLKEVQAFYDECANAVRKNDKTLIEALLKAASNKSSKGSEGGSAPASTPASTPASAKEATGKTAPTPPQKTRA